MSALHQMAIGCAEPDGITSFRGGSKLDFSCHLIKLVLGSSEMSDSDRAAFLP